MATLPRGGTSNCSNPVLDVFFSVNGILTDVTLLEFQVFDVSTPANQLNPIQVYPATQGQRAQVNVGIVCPAVNAGKLSTGRFVATWTVPSNEVIGGHRIKWFFKLTPTSVEQTFQEEFEVLDNAAMSGDDGYCFVQDIRDEGVTVEMASDTLVARRIKLASRMIDKATGNFFLPRVLTLKLDGVGGPMLLLNVPIIAVEELTFDLQPFDPAGTVVDVGSYRVYNRHLSQNLTSPDDRDNPKIELYNPAYYSAPGSITGGSGRVVFPRGQQNVTVDGVFGYTDWDPNNAQGVTPELIRHACKLIVMRELPLLVDQGARSDVQQLWRLTSERTRDQAYTLAAPPGQRSTALLTGDPAIDGILAMYLRPPLLGAA